MSRLLCLYFDQLINSCVCVYLSEIRIDTYVLHAFDLIITITGTCLWKRGFVCEVHLQGWERLLKTRGRPR